MREFMLFIWYYWIIGFISFYFLELRQLMFVWNNWIVSLILLNFLELRESMLFLRQHWIIHLISINLTKSIKISSFIWLICFLFWIMLVLLFTLLFLSWRRILNNFLWVILFNIVLWNNWLIHLIRFDLFKLI